MLGLDATHNIIVSATNIDFKETAPNHALAQCLAPALSDTTQVIENQSCFIKFTTSSPALMPVRRR